MKKDARETALNIIQRTIEHGAYPNILIDRVFSSKEFSSEDKALITRLVYGVLENKLYLDWVIQRFSKIKGSRITPAVYSILRLSIFQLLFLDKIPSFAAVYEGVEITKNVAGAKAAGFVNAILRSIIRSPEKTNPPSMGKNAVLHISIKHSHAKWIVEDWIKIFGEGFTEDLCKVNNKIPKITLRVNTLRTDRDGLMDELAGQGIHIVPGIYCDSAAFVEKGTGLFKSNAYRDGLFYVQDESSMLAVEIFDPKPGELIIDLCSAPGGKTTYAAQLMGNSGRIIARDINKNKLSLVKDNCERLGIYCVETEVFDALKYDFSLEGRADRVLVDAPCSGLGIIRRQPDIKWTKEKKHCKDLGRIQRRILENAALYVKPGGYLLYCTCSIMPGENQDIVKEFLKENPRFKLWDFAKLLPENLIKDYKEKGYLQLFPNVHGTDGFFICKLRRI